MREELRAINKLIGQRIKGQRKRAGITQESLAQELDLTFQQVQKYENGVNRVSAATLWKIADILGFPLHEFFGIGSLTPMTRPSVLYRPKLMIDGNRWCALYGDNCQKGVSGFGNTPEEAMAAFDEAFGNKLPPMRNK